MSGGLSRSLNLTQLIFYGVGTIVGAGIYTILGEAAGVAGRAAWVSLVLAGLVAMVTALSYAELIAAFPKAGAEYQFLKAAFPKWRVLAFLAGYLIALNCAATSATVSLAFAGYLAVFWSIPAGLTAFVLLAICTALNVAGLKQSTWVSIALICVEVGGLVLLVGSGFVNADVLSTVKLPGADDLPGLLATTALIFFVFIGFEDVANLAEEAKQPARDVPRALLVSVSLVSVIYLLVTWVALAVSEPAALAQSRSPLTEAGRRLGPWLGSTLAVTALFATASTALISLVSISRMLFGMARDGDMPPALASTVSRRKTPWVAALVLMGAACALLPLGQVKTIASISALGILLVFIGVQSALIALRLKQPELERPFRLRGSIGAVPVLPVLGIACCAALVTQFEPIVYLVAGGALVPALIGYALMRRWRASSHR
jgi:APA family basic amino acid/polyamine antiporter